MALRMIEFQAEQILSTDYFSKANWPASEGENLFFSLQGELLFDAAKIIAIAAYPMAKDLRPNRPAHSFSRALIAWMFRTARKRSYIGRLPKWVTEFKAQQMNGRIRAGISRIDYRLKGYLTFMDVENLQSEEEQMKAGIMPGITMRSSEDFSRMQISIRVDAHQLPPAWKVSMTKKSSPTRAKEIDAFKSKSRVIQSSFRSVISRHRKAFGRGSGDLESDYKNIYNRYIRTIFPVLHIMPTLHEAMIEIRARNQGRKISEVLLLLLQPEWAKEAPAKIAKSENLAILRVRNLGFPFCSCRLIRLRPAG